ncbi:hypothetical protein, partial [Burkholderia multivorans]|uniref:hypothetical protein n=1 Tax=Burkholderia multivorans TaxID=87883 RepID=UPI0021C0F525
HPRGAGPFPVIVASALSAPESTRFSAANTPSLTRACLSETERALEHRSIFAPRKRSHDRRHEPIT